MRGTMYRIQVLILLLLGYYQSSYAQQYKWTLLPFPLN
jgi:hypothetical protein